MRRALLIAVLCLAGCGDGDRAPARRPISGSVAPPAASGRPAAPLSVAGTTLSAGAVADAASGVPLASGPRPDLEPLPAAAFRAPIARYRVYSARQAAGMAADVRALAAALRNGRRAAAQRAWSAAYGRYLRIGAAYGALGDLDAAIDGTPGGLARGVRDPRFRGLHRIEHGLWTGQPPASLTPWATRLAADVARLRRTVGRMEITPLDYAVRAHEILEDAQRDLLSGVAAPWSGAGVMATAASVEATETVIGTLHGLLAGRDALAPVETGLAGLRAELAALRRAHGGWPPLDALSRRERQRLNGRLGAALELLARLPGALETRLPPVIPELAP